MATLLSFEEGIGRLLDMILEKQEGSDQDYMFLIGGMEGSGKSMLELDCIDYIDEKRGYETSIDNVTFGIKDFAGALYNSKNGAVCALDEGKELEAANWNSKEVKSFKKAITKIRKAGHIYFICFPNPSSMTGYIKNDKLVAVFMIKNKGVAYVYSKDNFAGILENLKVKSIKNIIESKANFVCEFPDYKGRLKLPYLDKKDREIHKAKYDFAREMGYIKEDKGERVRTLTRVQEETIEDIKLGLKSEEIALKRGISVRQAYNRAQEARFIMKQMNAAATVKIDASDITGAQCQDSEKKSEEEHGTN